MFLENFTIKFILLQLRGTVATLIMAISLGTDFALLKLFSPLTLNIGYHPTFWLFSAICLSNVFYLIFCVPETKMRSLEDIYADLEGRSKRKKKEIKGVVETNDVWRITVLGLRQIRYARILQYKVPKNTR